MALHTLYAIEFADGGPTVLGGITAQRFPTGTEIESGHASGQVYPQFTSISGQRPTFGWTTRALTAAFNKIPLAGLSIASLTSGLNLWAYKKASGGTRAGNVSHRKYNAVKGIVVLRSLRVDHQGNAGLECEAMIAHDGSGNDPIIITDSATPPTGVADGEQFTIGPLRIGSTTYDHVTSMEIDFGVSIVPQDTDSSIWPLDTAIDMIAPRITLRGIDVEWLKAANVPLTGRQALSGDLTQFFLRKRKAGTGTYVLDATAEHIKIQANGTVHIDPAFDAGGPTDNAECSLVLTGEQAVGGQAPLVITPDSVIEFIS